VKIRAAVPDLTPSQTVADILRGGASAGSANASRGHLAPQPSRWHRGRVDEEQGIYREEVLLMMGALADIYANTGRILAILGDEEDGDEEEEVDA
jgi:hypothetical protein